MDDSFFRSSDLLDDYICILELCMSELLDVDSNEEQMFLDELQPDRDPDLDYSEVHEELHLECLDLDERLLDPNLELDEMVYQDCSRLGLDYNEGHAELFQELECLELDVLRPDLDLDYSRPDLDYNEDHEEESMDLELESDEVKASELDELLLDLDYIRHLDLDCIVDQDLMDLDSSDGLECMNHHSEELDVKVPKESDAKKNHQDCSLGHEVLKDLGLVKVCLNHLRRRLD